MGRFSREPRADDDRGPFGVSIKKSTESFEKKGEVLLVRFPATDGDDLVLFGDGGVELKDIGLNGVRNTVDFGGVDPKAGGKGFPKISGMRGFDSNSREKFKSAGQASFDPGGGEDGGKRVEN
jgi:hypothetical protein